MLALFHICGRGTVFVYQGQEIGMANSGKWTFDELRDVEEINHYNAVKASRPEEADMDDVLRDIQRIGRDNARLPVSWTASENAGFSSGTPWIKVNEDYREWNVESQQNKKDSVLEFWRDLLLLRKQELVLVYGLFQPLDEGSEEIYAFTRSDVKVTFTVICSFTAKATEWACPQNPGKLVLSNYSDHSVGESSDTCMALQPFECRLYRKDI